MFIAVVHFHDPIKLPPFPSSALHLTQIELRVSGHRVSDFETTPGLVKNDQQALGRLGLWSVKFSTPPHPQVSTPPATTTVTTPLPCSCVFQVLFFTDRCSLSLSLVVHVVWYLTESFWIFFFVIFKPKSFFLCLEKFDVLALRLLYFLPKFFNPFSGDECFSYI